MRAAHLEIETKFDAPVAYVVPDLAEVPGVASVDEPVAHDLEAHYFDTDDLRLARARITLRRRTGGTDDGWHVKLPASGAARLELHRPLGRAGRRPPKAVLDSLAGVLRGAEAVPVVQLRTHRVVRVLRDADGRALAEVADDVVTATRLAAAGGAADVRSWREVEVELLDGDRDLLAPVGERLVAAGAEHTGRASKLSRALDLESGPAPETTTEGPRAGEVVVEALRERVTALELADVAVRTGQDDGIHQLRVACRQLRSLLAAFRPVLDRGATDPWRAELSELTRRLGEARDDEVALAQLRADVAELPVELVLGPVAARLQAASVAAAEQGRKAAVAVLQERRHLDLLDGLHALLDEPPLTERAAKRAAPVLRTVLRRESRRLRRAVAAADERSDARRTEALHAVRRTARRTRFTAEAVAPVLGAEAVRIGKAAKKVQRLLGALQDTVVVGERCRRLAVAAHAAGEPGFTYGVLLGRAEARAREAEHAFVGRWPDLAERLR